MMFDRFDQDQVKVLTDDELIALFSGPPREADYAATIALLREICRRDLEY